MPIGYLLMIHYYPNYLSGFNNQGGAGGNSCIDIFYPPYDGYNYSKTPGQAYAPATYAWRYTASCQNPNEGSSQQLPNGNSLVCLTVCSSIVEVDHNGTTRWSFNPGGRATNAMRYTKCFVRGPEAYASASSSEIDSGAQVTLYSHATSITENNPVYTYSWTSIPPGFTSSLQNPTLSPTSTATYIVNITDTTIGCSDTASVTVKVVVTGVDEQAGLKDEIVIYPNPTPDLLNIECKGIPAGNYLFVITDVLGQKVKEKEFKTANQDLKVHLDLKDLSTGIYFLIVSSGDYHRVFKIEKQ